MASPRSEFAVLLAAPNPVEAEMARELLASHGIPSMLHGVDRDYAELGAAAHSAITRPDLLIPRSALERARQVLAETWDESALSDELATEASPSDAVPARSLGGKRITTMLLVLLALVVAVICVTDFVLPALHATK
ncbi:MAG: DUF2007 domain-containing protein [Planctomycetota bacterium]